MLAYSPFPCDLYIFMIVYYTFHMFIPRSKNIKMSYQDIYIYLSKFNKQDKQPKWFLEKKIPFREIHA